jgi:DNA repair exonuclease SbcCD nuclease subunit
MIPDAIFTGDWHLREDTPLCRTDDFQKSQWEKVKFIAELQEKYECNVYHAGDLFHHWKPSPWLLSKAMQYLPKQFYTIYGNHDLPQHNLDLADKCGIYVLEKAGKLTVLNGVQWNLNGVHWGINPEEITNQNIIPKLLIWHIMTYVGSEPYPGCPDSPAELLLKKYPQYEVILTGHNHQSFQAHYKGRVLINPGSITRQDADQDNFRPAVWLYYSDTNTVEPVYLPIEKGVVSREHIEKKQERDDRISSFISKLDTDFKTSINFETNLERFFKQNKIQESVKELIYKTMEV